MVSPSPDAGRPSPGGTVGAVIDGNIKTVFRVVEVADATVRGAVERGVETAYMVIEEYMLRGQQSAGQHHARKGGEMNGDRSYGNGGGAGWSGGGWGAGNPMLAPWMQMMRVWSDAVSQFVPGGAMGAEWMNQFVPGMCPPAPGAGRAKVSVHIASAQPAEVTVDLQPGAEFMDLTLEPLVHADREAAPSLNAADIVTRQGHIRVRITVPSDQPHGRYSGAIHDSAGVPRGELIVEIEAARAKTRRARKPKA